MYFLLLMFTIFVLLYIHIIIGSKATFAVTGSHHKSQMKYKDLILCCDYEIFDTPGLDRFADIITLYLRGALAVIVVYDVSSPKSLHKAKWWIDYLENNASGYDKIILIANKIDIKDNAVDDDDDDDTDSDSDCDSDDDDDDNTTAGGGNGDNGDIVKEGRMYATEHGLAFLEISAKTRDNVSVLLSWIDKQCKKKVANNPQLIAKKDAAIQLHEGLLSGQNKRNGKFFKLQSFEFDYSKCCAF